MPVRIILETVNQVARSWGASAYCQFRAINLSPVRYITGGVVAHQPAEADFCINAGRSRVISEWRGPSSPASWPEYFVRHDAGPHLLGNHGMFALTAQGEALIETPDGFPMRYAGLDVPEIAPATLRLVETIRRLQSLGDEYRYELRGPCEDRQARELWMRSGYPSWSLLFTLRPSEEPATIVHDAAGQSPDAWAEYFFQRGGQWHVTPRMAMDACQAMLRPSTPVPRTFIVPVSANLPVNEISCSFTVQAGALVPDEEEI